MYLGLTTQGIQLMLLFFFTVFLSAAIELEFLVIFLPIIWFYSIFDVRSKAASEEPLLDSSLKIFSNIEYSKDCIRGTTIEKYIGYFLITIGLLALFNNLLVPIICHYVDLSIIRYIKSIIISMIFIASGLFLLRKKKILYLKAGEEKCKEEE